MALFGRLADDASGNRTLLGATTVGAAVFTVANPSAVRFFRINADNTVTLLSAADFLTAIGGGAGTVTSFGAGDLSPLFTTSVANSTTTPALTFTLSTANANKVLAGPTSGAAAAPTYRSLVVEDLPNLDFTNASLADADRIPFYDDSAAANRDSAASDVRTYMQGGCIVLRDEKSSGTNGGTFTSGAWRTRDINTEATDTGGDCSISANQFTLNAGTYEIRASAPGFLCSQHQAKLYNVTDAADTILGTCEYNGAGSVQTRSVICGRFTIAASKAFEIRHYCATTKATDGFGTANSLGTEVYTEVSLKKVS